MQPIFDASAHPTVEGTWYNKANTNTFNTLTESLANAGFIGACAVGLYGADSYDHKLFLEGCQDYPQLVPIAGFNPYVENLKAEFDFIIKHGAKGIKIHPRLSSLSLEKESDRLIKIFQQATEHNLVVFLCTYCHGEIENYPEKNPLYSLVSILKAVPKTKMVLVHGGDVQLLDYVQLARFNENLLIDLSYTIMKYEGSSIDFDIQYLFKTFDRRICIGTDWPEYTHHELRKRFESFAKGLAIEKLENIAWKNISTFLNIDFRCGKTI